MIEYFKPFQNVVTVNLSNYSPHATLCNSDIPKISPRNCKDNFVSVLEKCKEGGGPTPIRPIFCPKSSLCPH
jgi:hypothetical protein